MPDLTTADLETLQTLVQGVQKIVDAPIAFERGDPDKPRMKEIQNLVALILRSELSPGNAERLVQLLAQLNLLFEEIVGVGTRVSMKPAARLVERAIGVVRGAAGA